MSLNPSISNLLQRPCWIFDLDGTLTRAQHDFAAIRQDLGVPENQGILEYIQACSEPERRRLEVRLVAEEERLARRAQAREGARELLTALANAGMQLGILTRNRRHCAVISLERTGLMSFFAPEAVVACEDARPKPDPEGIHRLLQIWGAEEGQALMLGDFRYDLEAARAAGVGSLCLCPETAPGWPELTDLRLRSLSELYGLWLQACP